MNDILLNTLKFNTAVSESVSHPPLSIELPPIKDLANQKFMQYDRKLPTLLEPIPILGKYNCHQTFTTRFEDFLPELVPSSSNSSSTSNPPSPIVNNEIPQRLPTIKPKPEAVNKCPYHQVMKKTYPAPLSPTMKAASDFAAEAATQHLSDVADTFLSSLNLSLSDQDDRPTPSAKIVQVDQRRPSFAKVSFMVYKRSSCPISAERTMLLTKNAHIKRPRNAWIHFRCHYGQALKVQDNTLRAEDISKRASRRWSALSDLEKKPWHDLAEQDKQAHKAAFPGYRYCPRRSSTAAMLAAKQTNQQQQQQQQQPELC